MDVFLDDREIRTADLEEGFYLCRFEGQERFSVPRRSRNEILKIISTAEKNVYLTSCNMPFIGIYKNFRKS